MIPSSKFWRNIAILFILAGILVNRYTLSLLTEDRAITSLELNAIILGFQIGIIGLGIYLYRKRRIDQVIINNTLLFAVVIGCIGLFELLVRLHIFGLDTFHFAKYNSARNIEYSGLIRPADHPEIGYQFKSNIAAYHKLDWLETNAHGLRDKAYSIAKPPGTFRIVIAGNSYTVPEGVPLQHAYHTLLENRLNQTRAHPCEVINFAVSGYSLRQIVATVEHRALAYDPDLIMVGYCPEQAHIDPFPNQPIPEYNPRPPGNILLKPLAIRLIHYGQYRVDQEAITNHHYTPAELTYVRQQISFLAAIRNTHQIPVLILFIDNRQMNIAPIIEIVREHNLPYVDLCSQFEGLNIADYAIYHQLDLHPNIAANQMFADRLWEYFQDNVAVRP